MSATIKLENKHFPVLLKELISIISPLYGGTFLDCTFGQGGYSKKILEKTNNKVIAIDRDQDVSSYAKELKKKYNKRFNFQNIKFSEISRFKIKSSDLKEIIFDLKNIRMEISFKSYEELRLILSFFHKRNINKINIPCKNNLKKDFLLNSIKISREFWDTLHKLFAFGSDLMITKCLRIDVIPCCF